MILILCLALPLDLDAQVGTQTVDLGDGYEIVVPAAWEVRSSLDGVFRMGDDSLTLTVMTPTRFSRLNLDLTESNDTLDALAIIGDTFILDGLTRDDFDKVMIGDRLMARYTNEYGDQVHFGVPLSDSRFGYVKLTGSQTDVTAFSDQFETIVASFDTAEPEPAAASGGGAACKVHASSANSSQLRVGPGENRSAIAFLPANTDVTVTGRAELDDGSVWFQLDKAEAAPQGTAAAELWVNEENVTTSGDCDRVGETNAPPVIPISAAPPPAPTAAPGQPAPPPVQAGALPASGLWTLSLAPITNASCLGYENVPFNTSDVYTQPTFNGTIAIVDGNSFTFSGNLFRRNGNSNSFSGAIEIPYEGGGSVTTQFRFDLISSTSMSGQMVANYNADDGTPCSDTVTFTARRG